MEGNNKTYIKKNWMLIEKKHTHTPEDFVWRWNTVTPKCQTISFMCMCVQNRQIKSSFVFREEVFFSAYVSVLLRVSPVAEGTVEPLGLAWVAKVPYTRLWKTSTALPRGGDGEPHTSIPQPAPVALVQTLESPCCIQLPHFGQLPSVCSAGPLCLNKVQRPCQEKHWSWVQQGQGIWERDIIRFSASGSRPDFFLNLFF